MKYSIPLIMALLITFAVSFSGCSAPNKAVNTTISTGNASENEAREQINASLEEMQQKMNELRQELSEIKSLLTAKGQSDDGTKSKEATDEIVQKYMDILNEPVAAYMNDPDKRSYYSNTVDKNKLDGSYDFIYGKDSYETIKDYLRYLGNLIENKQKYLTKEGKDLVAALPPETTTLGFANIPLTVIGTMYDQNYVINKLNLEMAIIKYKNSTINPNELELIAQKYKKSRGEYENFIKNAWYGD
ncbi:MAG: hypothetical protein Q7J78_00830 [Clostridiales bacterium]|nr:hypothetical protein [Clostridiales bacterium]